MPSLICPPAEGGLALSLERRHGAGTVTRAKQGEQAEMPSHTESSGRLRRQHKPRGFCEGSERCAPAVPQRCTHDVRARTICLHERSTQREPTTKVKRTEAGEERGLWISCEKCQRRGEKKKKAKKTPTTTGMTTNPKTPKRTPPSQSNRVPSRRVHCNSSSHTR